MYGYIYLTTNLVNGKIYIGRKKSSIFLSTKYLGSGRVLKQAIKKYGKINFSVLLLQECFSNTELNSAEKYWIYKYNSQDISVGYNIQAGGYHEVSYDYTTSESTKLKQSISQKQSRDLNGPVVYLNKEGIVVRPWAKDTEEIDNYLKDGWKFGNPNACHYGINVTNGTTTKIIKEDELDDYLNNGFWVGRHWNPGKGRTQSQEEKRLRSKIMTNKYKGTMFVNNGEETKRISPDELNNYLSCGWKEGMAYSENRLWPGRNSDRVWINDGSISKFVKKSDVNSFLDHGWSYGRVYKVKS